MLTFVYILLFILGAVFGSFGGVIIERGREGYSRDGWREVFGGRSYCPGCDGKLLTWWQLIPVVGRLVQKGKCFRCKSSIPQWYCWIEIVMGGVFALTGWWILGGVDLFSLDASVWIHLGLWCLINWCLVLIILADLQYYELNLYVWMLLIVFALADLGVMYGAQWEAYVPVLIGTVVLTGLFLFIYLAAKWYATQKLGESVEGFGQGDVLMSFSLGLLLPVVFEVMGAIDRIVSIQWLFTYLVVSSVLGMLYWIGRSLILKNDDGFLPFLPAMIVAFWLMIGASSFLNSRFVGL